MGNLGTSEGFQKLPHLHLLGYLEGRAPERTKISMLWSTGKL